MTAPACDDCTAATTQLWHGFRRGCTGCTARALARSPEFHECKRLGRLTSSYRSLLALGLVTHDEVKSAAAVDFMTIARAGA